MIETSSDLFQRSLNSNLRWSADMFGKCSETFVWPSENFRSVFGKLSKTLNKLNYIVKNNT